MDNESVQLSLFDALLEKGLNPAWATRKARMIEQLQKEMLKNIVGIVFRRKDGVVVHKLATLNPAFLPKDKTSVMPRPNHPEQIIFWSLRDRGYRSFLAHNFFRTEKIQSIGELIQEKLLPENS